MRLEGEGGKEERAAESGGRLTLDAEARADTGAQSYERVQK